MANTRSYGLAIFFIVILISKSIILAQENNECHDGYTCYDPNLKISKGDTFMWDIYGSSTDLFASSLSGSINSMELKLIDSINGLSAITVHNSFEQYFELLATVSRPDNNPQTISVTLSMYQFWFELILATVIQIDGIQENYLKYLVSTNPTENSSAKIDLTVSTISIARSIRNEIYIEHQSYIRKTTIASTTSLYYKNQTVEVDISTGVLISAYYMEGENEIIISSYSIERNTFENMKERLDFGIIGNPIIGSLILLMFVTIISSGYFVFSKWREKRNRSIDKG